MTKLNRKHGIEVGSKVKVLNNDGDTSYGDLVGTIQTVTRIDTHYPHECDIIRVAGKAGGQHPHRFELISPAIKVGDKVLVAREIETRDPNGMGFGKVWSNAWVTRMTSNIGKEFVVTGITDGNVYLNDVTSCGYPLAALELVEENPCDFSDYNGVDDSGNKVKFATADLLPFQRVVLRDGKKGVVAYGSVLRICTGRDSYEARLDFRKEGIGGSAKYDIVEVYDRPAYARDALDIDQRGRLLFRSVDFAEQQRKKEAAEKAVADAKAALAVAEAAAAALN